MTRSFVGIVKISLTVLVLIAAQTYAINVFMRPKLVSDAVNVIGIFVRVAVTNYCLIAIAVISLFVTTVVRRKRTQ